MRRATASEERSVQDGMARHGVFVRDVWVRPGEVANAWAPVRGRMWASEGFWTAPAWRQAAFLAHEAGHVRLRHVPWCMALLVVVEAAQVPGRMALGPTALASPWGWGLSMAVIFAAQAVVLAGLVALGRWQEFAADRWAVEHGGIAGGKYKEHLALLPQLVTRGFANRLLETHPSNERRIERVRRGAAAA